MRGTELKKLEKLLEMNAPKEKILEAMKPNNRRRNGHKVPEGGISLREAERKYNVDHSTLSRWVQRGWVKVIERTANWLFINENSLVEAINKYRS